MEGFLGLRDAVGGNDGGFAEAEGGPLTPLLSLPENSIIINMNIFIMERRV